MRHQALELRRLLLDEAVGREAHADQLSDMALLNSETMHGPTLRTLAHSQRIRAMELHGQAAALAIRYGLTDHTDA
ncbi:hypothetical protein R1A27_00315 [Methylobacterium sp. NMS12]|uniref:hypothetical protein n=1 Tax=Methylobacterium sp. NMS12 TaxID=3079766 RepID=UPI003F8844E5